MPTETTFRSQQRAEAARETSPSWLDRVLRFASLRVGWRAALIALLLFVGVTAVTLWEPPHLPYRLGQFVETPIVARVDFSRVSLTDTLQQRQNARLNTPNFYKPNDALFQFLESEFRDLRAAVQAADAFDKLKPPRAGRFALDEQAFKKFRELLPAFENTTRGGANAALPPDPSATKSAYARLTTAILADLRDSTLVLPPAESQRSAPHAARYAVFAARIGESRVDLPRLWHASNPKHIAYVAAEVARASAVPAALRDAVQRLLVRCLSPSQADIKPPQAPYIFDRARTEAELAKADLLPPVLEPYKRGTVLVPPGEITGEQLSLLDNEYQRYLVVRDTDPQLARPWRQEQIGRVLLVLIVTLSLMIYARIFQPRVVMIYTRGMALAALLLGILVANRILDAATVSPLWIILTVNVAAALLTLAYNQRFALGVAAATAMLSTLVNHQTIGLFVCQVAAAATTVTMLSEVRTRLWLVWVGLASGTVTAAVAAAVGLTEKHGALLIANQALFAGFAAMIGVFIILIVLPLIERAFRIATSLTLLEWADTSRPLLRQLIQKAPGTWQHSHLLANMAETAAAEIGANGLLARVGAYYHDIGKISKPEYFVENQAPRQNAHSKLAPTMSTLVILGHVKDGLALAREHGLPTVLHKFIAEHHGTTVVRYFHARAAQQHADRGGDPDDRTVDETEFRYPGPKPSSKESAILMLCDGVEGAVRTLQDPTPGRIEAVVHEICMARLMDAQFDNCDITLKQLARVEQSLVKSLCAIYHGRIVYPKSAEPSPSDSRISPKPPVRQTA